MKYYILIIVPLLFQTSNAQSFTQIGSYPFGVTQVKYDSAGNEYVIRQQGELLKNHKLIKSFPVMFRDECGLIGFDFAPGGFVLHLSGEDSIQRILYFDTGQHEIDTILEVPYNVIFGSINRWGGIYYGNSTLYCSFGVGNMDTDAQDLDSFRGKLIKIPRISDGWGSAEIVEYGLRNPYRFSFNGGSGFITDSGNYDSEEVNYVTENYSLANQGWPCYDNTVQLIIPDTVCDGYALSFPEYSYTQAEPRAIIGGCFFNGNYYFADHYSGFGGYLDTDWTFHELTIPFPKYVTSMAVNTNTLMLSTWTGEIYQFDEIAVNTPSPDDAADNDLSVSVYNIQGQLITRGILGDEIELLPGIYILVITDRLKIKWIKKIIKI